MTTTSSSHPSVARREDTLSSTPLASTSTADSWNRIRDKGIVERSLGLPEFSEQGNFQPGYPKFYTRFSSSTAPSSLNGDLQKQLVASGYTRVVYGDHGAYIEFEKSQINFESLVLNEKKAQNAPHRYYDEWFTLDKSVMVYDQLKSVEGKKAPPKDGKANAVNRNRAEGYADYVVGRCYVDPEQVLVELEEKQKAKEQKEDDGNGVHTTGKESREKQHLKKKKSRLQ